MFDNDKDFRRNRPNVAPVACFGAAALGFLLMTGVTVIPAGHVGVVDLFGAVRPDPLPAGLTFVNPFAKVVRMSVMTQLVEMAEDVPTKEGMSVHLEAAALVHLKPSEAVRMYTTVGADYQNKVVIPQFRSVVRSVSSGHEAKDLYTSDTRDRMTQDLKDGLERLIAFRGLVVEETPLKKLELPHTLRVAIEDKLQAEQASQKMQFVLERERQEANRKAIEADGIAKFQQIVSGDITEGMLRWKGIEATSELAHSRNAKVVIIGSGRDGLPLILGNDHGHPEKDAPEKPEDAQQQQSGAHAKSHHH